MTSRGITPRPSWLYGAPTPQPDTPRATRTPVRNADDPLDWGRAPGSARRARRARTQPQERRRRVPARPARRHHRPVRLAASRSLAFDTIYAEGQRRYVESLSAYARQFLGPDGEAGRRPDRRPVAGHLDRPEGRVAEPALDGRDGHRDLRPPAAAVRADRHPALPERPRHRAPVRPADRRPGPGAARGHPPARPRPAHQGPQDRG